MLPFRQLLALAAIAQATVADAFVARPPTTTAHLAVASPRARRGLATAGGATPLPPPSATRRYMSTATPTPTKKKEKKVAPTPVFSSCFALLL